MAVQKTRIPGFVKDTSTGAVLNTMTTELDQIRQNRIRKRETMEMQERITKLEDGLSDIKNDLSKILEALNK